jgi:hypothetical protein
MQKSGVSVPGNSDDSGTFRKLIVTFWLLTSVRMAVPKLYSSGSESVSESGSSFKKPIPIPTPTPIFASSHK